jgi:hypothetical protein
MPGASFLSVRWNILYVSLKKYFLQKWCTSVFVSLFHFNRTLFNCLKKMIIRLHYLYFINLTRILTWNSLLLCLTNYARRHGDVWRGVDVQIHVFLISPLLGGDQLHAPVALPPPPGNRPRAHWIGPRIGLDYMERRIMTPLPWLELRPLCSPACSQSLYRPSYSGILFYYGI